MRMFYVRFSLGAYEAYEIVFANPEYICRRAIIPLYNKSFSINYNPVFSPNQTWINYFYCLFIVITKAEPLIEITLLVSLTLIVIMLKYR